MVRLARSLVTGLKWVRGLPWKESSAQAGGLDERTSSLFLIVSVLSLKKSRKRFGRSVRRKTVAREDGFLFPSIWLATLNNCLHDRLSLILLHYKKFWLCELVW